MENIAQMVDESLARHGVEPTFDHLRLQWSKWFRCDSSFSVLLCCPQVRPYTHRGAETADCGSMPKVAMRVNTAACACGWASPPMVP